MHVEALRGLKLSLEPPRLRRCEETMEGLQYPLGVVAWGGGFCKLFNWEISESGCGTDGCSVSEGEGSLTRSGRTKRVFRGAADLLTLWHISSH